jgi:fatty-acid desaturase
MLGYRTFATPDQSTNCWWVALISWGEGWHNNHHAFPFSARHGLRWFEVDLTWWHVRVLAFLRLADRVKVPTKAMQQRLRDIARSSRSSRSYVT